MTLKESINLCGCRLQTQDLWSVVWCRNWKKQQYNDRSQLYVRFVSFVELVLLLMHDDDMNSKYSEISTSMNSKCDQIHV